MLIGLGMITKNLTTGVVDVTAMPIDFWIIPLLLSIVKRLLVLLMLTS